ncbi:mannose-6-phosphate isomerase-like protein (cupin superfamily) [Nocardia transvalensis]|uniref:Mannose-6-phosphate isomerase-like protein (Cupin superfamily) n=1 Tax=Nocardia transvalensis TaxID=37333 RepID=A0A7W9PFQ6_9NOCA|nr:cupin domain-containing protein [Nocardia transvalensis]MBB5915171.1 mannose-6-phosphate isomerase-like protein (cupin superfamily) [Nocardia transvalensis]
MRTNERALLVRHEEAERLETLGVTLYADHDMTGGALSGNRAYLPAGTDGPPPHYHRTSAELFYLLGGALRVLAGEEIVVLGEGDFLLIPPCLPHAWAAPDDAAADVLVLFTPGIERFEYFRLGDRIRKGEASPAEILDTQERYDNHFVDSPIWRRDRHADSRSPLDPDTHRAEFLAADVFRATGESFGGGE